MRTNKLIYCLPLHKRVYTQTAGQNNSPSTFSNTRIPVVTICQWDIQHRSKLTVKRPTVTWSIAHYHSCFCFLTGLLFRAWECRVGWDVLQAMVPVISSSQWVQKSCTHSTPTFRILSVSRQNNFNIVASYPFKAHWHQMVTFWSVQCRPGLTYIFNFWHLGTLALRTQRQSAGISEI